MEDHNQDLEVAAMQTSLGEQQQHQHEPVLEDSLMSGVSQDVPLDGSSYITPTSGLGNPDPALNIPGVVLDEEQPPALDFNGYILHAMGSRVPEELRRQSSGGSVVEPGALFDVESGRMYHNHHSGRYWFPNDPAEQDRLDLQHKLWTLIHDGALHRAPVESPKIVLDVATGTGIWAIEFAKQHPDSKVVGTDISLIQPENAPSNCTFVREDAEKDEWIFPDPFDFIFLRMVMSCFDDASVIIKKAFQALKPGGWIEYNDFGFEVLSTDGSTADTGIQKFCELANKAAGVLGRDFYAREKYKTWMIEAGFVDVVEDILPLPINPWPVEPKFRDLGRWMSLNTAKGTRGLGWKLFRCLGLEPDEIEQLVEQTIRENRDLNIHGFIPVYVVYGRKPEQERPARDHGLA